MPCLRQPVGGGDCGPYAVHNGVGVQGGAWEVTVRCDDLLLSGCAPVSGYGLAGHEFQGAAHGGRGHSVLSVHLVCLPELPEAKARCRIAQVVAVQAVAKSPIESKSKVSSLICRPLCCRLRALCLTRIKNTGFMPAVAWFHRLQIFAESVVTIPILSASPSFKRTFGKVSSLSTLSG